MKLQEQINRIQSMMGLNESENDLSPLLEKLLYSSIVEPNSDVVCKIKVKHPKDREVLEGQPRYTHYSVTLYVIGGHGTKYWPQTMAVRDLYDNLMNESWDIVHNFTNIPTDIYYVKVKSCDEK